MSMAKAFSVFWKDANPPKAVVVAEDLNGCIAIASTYGEVISIHAESDRVISEPKPEQVFLESA